MTAATSEDCIGRLLENCSLMGEEMELLTAKDLNILRWIFLMGEISDCRAGFFPLPRVSHKGSGEGETLHTWWKEQFCDIFGKKVDTWRVIMGDNPAVHSFVLRDLVLIELFQISHNCVNENTLQTNYLLKLI